MSWAVHHARKLHRFCTVSAPKPERCGNRHLSLNELQEDHSTVVQFWIVRTIDPGKIVNRSRKGKVMVKFSDPWVGRVFCARRKVVIVARRRPSIGNGNFKFGYLW